MSGYRELVAADLEAMQERRPITGSRIAARMLVHARWRAVVLWRLAQWLMARRATKFLSLWVSDVTLAMCGAELQPTARIGPGLVLKHTTGLVVGGEVVAGRGLVLHQNVTLGDRLPFGGQPILGDDVVVGAGAIVLGPITVGDRATVAAGAVVLEDVPDGVVVAGNPARIVSRGEAGLPRAPVGPGEGSV